MKKNKKNEYFKLLAEYTNGDCQVILGGMRDNLAIGFSCLTQALNASGISEEELTTAFYLGLHREDTKLLTREALIAIINSLSKQDKKGETK